MKKKLFVFVLVIVALLASTTMAWAVEFVDDVPKDSHKIKNKWDLAGTFVAHPGYNWAGMAEQATWTYKVHVKEAMDGEYSKGTIHFTTVVDGTEIDVVGQVDATSRNYMWGDLAAVGTAEYNGQTYYFMFLFVDYAVWFALSTTPYDSYWAVNKVWEWGNRTYQLHSQNPGSAFLLDYKTIHE